MTDDEKVAMIALMLGDIEGSPYYPLFSTEQYKQFLLMGKGSVNTAVVSAAISASFIVSSESTREVIGDLSISRSTGAGYLKALDYLIKSTNKQIPAGLMPWVGGLGEKNKLLDFRLCDDRGYIRPLARMSDKPSDNPLNELAVSIHENKLEIDQNKADINSLSTGTTQNVVRIDGEVAGLKQADSTLATRVTSVEGRITVLEGDRTVTLQRVTDLEGNTKYVEVNDLYGGGNGDSGQA